MRSDYPFYRELWRLITRPVFLLVDLLGIIGLIMTISVQDPFKGALAAVGSAFLTIGLSLPIAVFYHQRATAQTLALIDKCHQAGIKAVFTSRQTDSPDLRVAIDSAVARSAEIRLLGIAFGTFFSASGEHTPVVRTKLDNPEIHMRILVLDPTSEAAAFRAQLEHGNTTIQDIKRTLEQGIPAAIQERLKAVYLDGDNLSLGDRIAEAQQTGQPIDDLIKTAITKCNLEVRLYTLQPIALMMIFNDTTFIEQYHLGRPKHLRARDCIGKHVPVLEYSATSVAAQFYAAHYETVWNISADCTDRVLRGALAP
jgi:hypothetical protein